MYTRMLAHMHMSAQRNFIKWHFQTVLVVHSHKSPLCPTSHLSPHLSLLPYYSPVPLKGVLRVWGPGRNPS